MYSELASFARTSAETQILISELEDILASSYKIDGGMVDSLKKIRASVAEIISRHIQSEGFKRDFILAILEKLKARRPLTLTIALEPTDELVRDIYSWVVNNVGNDIVLELSTDEGLIGGAVVSFEGRIIEFSLRKILDGTLDEKASGPLGPPARREVEDGTV